MKTTIQFIKQPIPIQFEIMGACHRLFSYLLYQFILYILYIDMEIFMSDSEHKHIKGIVVFPASKKKNLLYENTEM